MTDLQSLYCLRRTINGHEVYQKAQQQSLSVAVCIERAVAALLLEPIGKALVRKALNVLPIAEHQAMASHQSLVAFPENIARFNPAPYHSLGACYGAYGPFMARADVVKRLLIAQSVLDTLKPGYALCVFDAYRPLAVQRFMVEYTIKVELRAVGLNWQAYCAEPNRPDHAAIYARVMQVWSEPNPSRDAPPPHSTGAAIDLTIKCPDGETMDMGSSIDFIGPESQPDFFADSRIGTELFAHQGRMLLNRCMLKAGFKRLPHEWWHFSYGDQWWRLLNWLESPTKAPQALYGRYE